MYMPNTKWTWSFLGIALFQAAVVLGFEAYVFAAFELHIPRTDGVTDPVTTAIPTFLALYIFGFIYQLFLVYDALRLKNTIQVIGLVLLNVGLLIYGGVQYDTISDGVRYLELNNDIESGYMVWRSVRPFMIAIPCVIAFCTCLMGFVSWKLYDEFAWTIYKHISADLRMKRRYLTYQIYIALLKFDFFFFLGFTIQFVVIVGGRTNAEQALTIAAIPVTILILIAAAWFTRREILTGMILVLVFFFGGMAYFIFKLYRMYQDGFKQPYIPARKELVTFAVITIILIVITIIYACICCANFGKGLKPYVTTVKEDPDMEKSGSFHYAGAPGSGGYGGPGVEMVNDPRGKNGRVVPTRMEID